MNFLGLTEGDGAAPVYQPGASTGHSEAAGYQPAAPRAIRTYLPGRERTALMSTSLTSTTATASILADQTITAFALAEIMTDPNTGESTFCVATDQNLSDFQAATPARGLAAAEKLREEADRIEALANEYAERVVIPALIEQYSIELEELDTASLWEDAPGLAAAFRIFAALQKNNTIVVVAPKGQAPVERLAAMLKLVPDLQKRPAA